MPFKAFENAEPMSVLAAPCVPLPAAKISTAEHFPAKDAAFYANLIRSCSDSKDLSRVHANIAHGEQSGNRFLGNLLIEMYGKCGSVDEAIAAFDSLRDKNLVSWNIMMKAYAQNGHSREAIALLQKMDLEGMQADICTYVTALSACSSIALLEDGRRFHARIAVNGLDSDVVLGTALVNMYGKCGMLEDARRVFEEMAERNVVSWTTMIVAYAQNGQVDEARHLFDKMPDRNVVSWTATIAAYAQNGYVLGAKSLFDRMPLRDVVAWTTMLTMFSQNGHLEEAKSLFDRMPEWNVVSWNAMIGAYAHNGHLEEAKITFDAMPKRDSVSWFSLFTAYAQNGDLKEAKSMFEQLPEKSVESWNVMLIAYARNGHLEEARTMFDTMPKRDAGSWHAIITACARNGDMEEARNMLMKMPCCDAYSINVVIIGYGKKGQGKKAVALFREMDLEGIQQLKETLAAALDACTASSALPDAREIHASAMDAGICLDVVVGNALVNVYGKCGSLQEAKAVFDGMVERDAVSWNTMLAAYIHNQELEQARTMFEKMPHRNTVAWTSMVAAYAQDGNLQAAKSMFDRMPERNVVSWNVMIVAYAQSGHSKEAFRLLQVMDLEGEQLDEITLVAVLDACAGISALPEGRLVHSEVVDKGLESGVVMGNALVNMYGKCGSTRDARAIFDNMSRRDVVSWTTMITSYAQNGYSKEPLELFRGMMVEGIEANEITMISVLSTCSHAGLMEDGWCYFVSLQADYGIEPQIEHFVCIIDQLGRAGRVSEAEELINWMPFEPDSVAWTTLIAACRINKDMKRGAHAAGRVVHLDPENATPYISTVQHLNDSTLT